MLPQKFRRDETGAVVVEFALVVPFFMLMVFGIIDFSRAYYIVNTINSSLREGARYGSTLRGTQEPSTTNGKNLIKTRMREFSSSFGAPIDTAQVTIGFDLKTVTVGVTNYQLTLVTPLTRYLAANYIRVTRTASFRWEGIDPTAPI